VRRTLTLLALVLLAGCGSGGTDPIVREAVNQLGARWIGKNEPPAGPVDARPLTRADINRSDTAAIWARLESDPAPTLMYASALNGPYVTFFSSFRQSVIMAGSRVTGTRGLGTDLLSSWSEGRDPVAQPLPPGSWPTRLRRTYEFPDDTPLGRLETFECRFEQGPTSEIVILQVRHRGVEISEYCDGPSGNFENLHFADVSTGFVWRTLQWTGPRMELLDIQVIEPFTGD
jgi:hypothetical protein